MNDYLKTVWMVTVHIVLSAHVLIGNYILHVTTSKMLRLKAWFVIQLDRKVSQASMLTYKSSGMSESCPQCTSYIHCNVYCMSSNSRMLSLMDTM